MREGPIRHWSFEQKIQQSAKHGSVDTLTHFFFFLFWSVTLYNSLLTAQILPEWYIVVNRPPSRSRGNLWRGNFFTYFT